MLKTVMVIDDNDSDLLYARIMLQRGGAVESVLTFESAIAALEHLGMPGHAPVDLILIDINMPEMSGYEFLVAYERLEVVEAADTVIVMLTSSPDPRDRDRALAFKAVRGYLTKPIDPAAARDIGRWLATPDLAG